MLDRKHLQQLFLAILGLGALALCYVIVQPFIGPIVSAVALAVLFLPVHSALSRRLHGRASLAATLSMLLLIVLIVAPVFWLISTLTSELSAGYAALKSKTAANGGWVEALTGIAARPLIYFGIDPADANNQVHQFVSDRLALASGFLLRSLQGVLSNVAGFLFDAIVSLFVFFFLLRDGKLLLGRTRSFLPLEHSVFDRLISEVGQSVLANVYGVGAVALAQGGLTGLLFYFVGVHSPVFWGVVAGFCSMIPIVGPPIVWVPVAVAFAATGAWGKAALVAFVGAAVIGTADNILRPWIVSGRVELHPLLVFISLLGGAQAFGFLGLFIGPAALSVTVVIFEVLKEGFTGASARQQPVPPQNRLPG